MNTASNSDLRSTFERAAGTQIAWTGDLHELATGYFAILGAASDGENPLDVLQCVSAALALANFAGIVGWVSDHGKNGLIRNAKAVRDHTMKQWEGKTITVTTRAGRGESAATHH